MGLSKGDKMEEAHKMAISMWKKKVTKELQTFTKQAFDKQYEYQRLIDDALRKLIKSLEKLNTTKYCKATVFMHMTGRSRRTYFRWLNKPIN